MCWVRGLDGVPLALCRADPWRLGVSYERMCDVKDDKGYEMPRIDLDLHADRWPNWTGLVAGERRRYWKRPQCERFVSRMAATVQWSPRAVRDLADLLPILREKRVNVESIPWVPYHCAVMTRWAVVATGDRAYIVLPSGTGRLVVEHWGSRGARVVGGGRPETLAGVIELVLGDWVAARRGDK